MNLSDVEQNSVNSGLRWNHDQYGADWEGTCATGRRQTPIRLSVDSVSRKNPKKPTNSFPTYICKCEEFLSYFLPVFEHNAKYLFV